MERRLQIIEFQSKQIVFFDFSRCKTKEEIIPIIEDAKKWFQDKDLYSVLTLTDVTDAHYDTEILNLLKELTLHNKPYVKAGAIIGITRPLMKLAYNVVMKFSQRNLQMFNTREQAMEWLANH